MRHERDLADKEGSVPVVTYSRAASPRRTVRTPSARAEPVTPFFEAAEVPPPGERDAPEVRAYRTARPGREATLAPDLLGEERRPRFVKIVVLLGVLAVLGGVGVLAASYKQAINAPVYPTTADAVPPGTDTGAASASVTAETPVAVPGAAIRNVMQAPTAAPPAGPAASASATVPSADAAPAPRPEPSAPAVAPTPHPRPQDMPTVQARADTAATASGRSDMDQLMDKVGQILATIPAEDETPPSAMSPDLPALPGAASASVPSATSPSALSAVAPNGSLMPLTVPGDTAANAGPALPDDALIPPADASAPPNDRLIPPAPIPGPPPLPVLR